MTTECDCGNTKDSRSKKCALCAKRGYPVDRNYDVTDDAIIKAISECSSILEAAQVMSVSRKRIASLAKKLDIDISHMKRGPSRPSGQEILVQGDRRINSTVRKLLIRDQIIPYKCNTCTMGPTWQDKELTLELNHINGDPCDNRLGNLEFLCPNCHSQTPTNKGRNARKGG